MMDHTTNANFIARAEKGGGGRGKSGKGGGKRGKGRNKKSSTKNLTGTISPILPLQLQPLANTQTAASRKKRLHYFNEKYNSEQMQLSPDKSLGRHSYFSLRAQSMTGNLNTLKMT